MTKRPIALVVALALSSNSAPSFGANDSWDTTDKVLGGGLLTAMVIDWGQTRYGAKHPERFKETTSKDFIGEHPSIGRVNNYFLLSTVFYGSVAHVLSDPHRKVFLGGALILRIDAVSRNYSVGVKIDFK